MLILPLHKKIDWKDPPLVTLLLLALNIMLFMLLQLDDDKELVEAMDYYQVSGLY
ncbi:MAG: hypothetical protein KZQ78_08225 [Candidatus Thiodiazotropha sp. (ex Ustalcina ferruginea)]|nr:hypothetical protein [Candidatus Thiodiazotropha sp. (ex Ustalcina ferruginea)]